VVDTARGLRFGVLRGRLSRLTTRRAGDESVEGRVVMVASDQKRVVLGLGSEAVRRRERCRNVGSGSGTGGGGPDEVIGRAVALDRGLVWI